MEISDGESVKYLVNLRARKDFLKDLSFIFQTVLDLEIISFDSILSRNIKLSPVLIREGIAVADILDSFNNILDISILLSFSRNFINKIKHHKSA